MSLNAANVVVSLGQEYGLHLVLEVIKIEITSRLLGEHNLRQARHNTQWNQNSPGNNTNFHSDLLLSYFRIEDVRSLGVVDCIGSR